MIFPPANIRILCGINKQKNSRKQKANCLREPIYNKLTEILLLATHKRLGNIDHAKHIAKVALLLGIEILRA